MSYLVCDRLTKIGGIEFSITLRSAIQPTFQIAIASVVAGAALHVSERPAPAEFGFSWTWKIRFWTKPSAVLGGEQGIPDRDLRIWRRQWPHRISVRCNDGKHPFMADNNRLNMGKVLAAKE